MRKGLLASAIVAGLMAGNIALAQEEGAATETKTTTKKETTKKHAVKNMKKHDKDSCKGKDGCKGKDEKKEGGAEKAPEGQD